MKIKDKRSSPPQKYILDKHLQPFWNEFLGKNAEKVRRKEYDEKSEKIEYVKIHVEPCQICGKYACTEHKQKGTLEIW